MNGLYSLAETTVAEPLVNLWSAWSFVIAPGPASLHLANYQIKAMESYLLNPASHVSASRDPSLIGGPFVDIPEGRAQEVNHHLQETKRKQSDNLVFATTFTDFQNKIVAEGRGQSLEPYYGRIPAPLKGYVELVYDYYNRAAIRVMEGLLYESKYYKSDLQSFRIAKLTTDDSRPFFISTPRLCTDGELHWQKQFGSEEADALFRLDIEPQPLDRLSEILGCDTQNWLASLFSAHENRPDREWGGDSARVRYIGHACVLLQWKGMSVLTDPCVGSRPSEGGLDRFSFHDLPDRIDYALVTHNHQDHFVLETLLRLRHRIGTLVVPKTHGLLIGDASLKTMARKIGFKNVVELDSFDSLPLNDGEIVAVPFLGEHADLAHGKAGYVVRFGRSQALFGADSDCLDSAVYEHVRQSLDPVQNVFIGTESVGAPMSWTYGPLFPRKPSAQHEQTRRYHGCNAAAALGILTALGAKRLYNYAMGMEPWMAHILGLNLTESSPQMQQSNELLNAARKKGLTTAERLFGKAEIILPADGN